MSDQRNCMITGCKEPAFKYVFDGVFWIRACKKHTEEFRSFSKDNNLTFKEKDL